MSWSRKSSTAVARRKPRPSSGLSHNLGSWKVLYNLEGDPIGRGYAGKVYRIHPKTIDCNSNSPTNGSGQFNSNAAELQITATTYACKSIRRWRCGKDTINKIRREIQAMNALQRDGGTASPTCLSKETSDGHFSIPAINPGLQLYAPSSAAPKLIAVHEDSDEVAIVMEYASGGNLYDLCNKVYRRPTSHSRCQISPVLPCSYQNFHTGYSLGENFSAVTTNKISNGLISAKSPFDFDPLPTCLPETYVIEVVRKVTEGLAYMHQNLQMVHLDIKAENILLREPFPSSDVFITDFGLATVLNDGKEHRELAGTPDYVAPEVINYDPISFATDMWSVGVLTYYLLTGVSPFLGEDKEETMQNVTHGLIEFPSRLFRGRSNESVAFLKKLLVRKPSDRLSAEQCLQHPWMKISSRICEEIEEEEEEEEANMDSMSESLDKSSSVLNHEDRAVCVRPLAKSNTKAPLLLPPKFIWSLPKISLPLVGKPVCKTSNVASISSVFQVFILNGRFGEHELALPDHISFNVPFLRSFTSFDRVHGISKLVSFRTLCTDALCPFLRSVSFCSPSDHNCVFLSPANPLTIVKEIDDIDCRCPTIPRVPSNSKTEINSTGSLPVPEQTFTKSVRLTVQFAVPPSALSTASEAAIYSSFSVIRLSYVRPSPSPVNEYSACLTEAVSENHRFAHNFQFVSSAHDLPPVRPQTISTVQSVGVKLMT